ncbi:MAG: MBL fold metallo-hydrolase [Rikenellaceae bacterium]|nr:MBL fold metallo-hydrolase [Rikenellaceae bacterium]
MGDRKYESLVREFTDSGQRFTSESMTTKDGHDLTVVFFSHASIGFIWDDRVIYVDPLCEYADYSTLPVADLVLVTHEHYDHLDKKAVEDISGTATLVIGSAEVAREYPQARRMSPGDIMQAGEGITVEAVPAYNVSDHQLQFHPRERGDNGYILNLGRTRIYISGDTEPTAEMAGFTDIDIMFLPVNQPYTMTLEQAAQAARTIGAPIFYPYHTGDTDIEKLKELLADTPSISVRIYPME